MCHMFQKYSHKYAQNKHYFYFIKIIHYLKVAGCECSPLQTLSVKQIWLQVVTQLLTEIANLNRAQTFQTSACYLSRVHSTDQRAVKTSNSDLYLQHEAHNLASIPQYERTLNLRNNNSNTFHVHYTTIKIKFKNSKDISITDGIPRQGYKQKYFLYPFGKGMWTVNSRAVRAGDSSFSSLQIHQEIEFEG